MIILSQYLMAIHNLALRVESGQATDDDISILDSLVNTHNLNVNDKNK